MKVNIKRKFFLQTRMTTIIRVHKAKTTIHLFQYPEWNEPGACVVEMAVSTNSRHIALLSDTGKLWIGSSDIRIKYCEYDAKSAVKPRQLAW